MKTLQIVFSPTGGTQKVVDILSEGLGGMVEKLDLTNKDLKETALSPEDIAVIAVPSYGGRVPALAAQRLGNIQGNQAKCLLVCVYGNRAYEDTLIELKDLAEQFGFQPVAAIAAIAEHSILHQYAAGRPNQKDREQLLEFAGKVIEKLQQKPVPGISAIPGNHPYKKAGGGGMVPKADKNCTQCGLCADNCPAQAINRETLEVTDAKECISCMRCVVNCPQSARKVNSLMLSAASVALKKACSEYKENELFL